jgi:hypothetical protein
MRKNLLLIFFMAGVISCNNKKKEISDVKEDTISTYQSWEAGLNDSTGRLELKRSDQPGPDSISVDAIIRFLNNRYPNVQLKFVRSSHDTLYVAVPEATYLTQQMGSTGPQIYFADVVFNLTEIPNLHYINFDMAEGDHAGPGILNRDTFKDE